MRWLGALLLLLASAVPGAEAAKEGTVRIRIDPAELDLARQERHVTVLAQGEMDCEPGRRAPGMRLEAVSREKNPDWWTLTNQGYTYGQNYRDSDWAQRPGHVNYTFHFSFKAAKQVAENVTDLISWRVLGESGGGASVPPPCSPDGHTWRIVATQNLTLRLAATAPVSEPPSPDDPAFYERQASTDADAEPARFLGSSRLPPEAGALVALGLVVAAFLAMRILARR